MPKIYGGSKIGKGTYIAENVIVGHPAKEERALLLENRMNEVEGAVVGVSCVLRDFGVLYSQANLGNRVQTGHHWMVREHSTVGEGSMVGSGVVVDDRCVIGKRVSLQTRAYIPTNTVIEDDVFVGPCVCITNDKYMGRGEIKLQGAHIERGARIGGNATILPGVRVGKDSLIAAGAIVTKDIEPYTMVAGCPARKIGDVHLDHRKY
jgi:acetyltransferase-like isoleucine patch superfamily enzyme